MGSVAAVLLFDQGGRGYSLNEFQELILCALGNLAFLCPAAAQQADPDSLKRLAFSSTDSLERCRNYYYAGTYEACKHPDISALYADSALTLALALQQGAPQVAAFLRQWLPELA